MADVYTRIGYIKGATGAQGERGLQGDPGDAATIQVGTVTTVPYGQTANVVNSGTESAAVFDFTIPQGRPGQETTDMQNLVLGSITTSAASFPVPAVGETGKVIFGKITKWFSDMSALVASKFDAANVVNNLTTTASGYALDARQGKALSDTLKAPWGTTSFAGSVDDSMIPDRVGLYLCYICASPATASSTVSVDISYGSSMIIRQLGVGNGNAYGGISAMAIVSATDTTTPIVFKSSNASSNAVYNRYGMMWIGHTGTRILPTNN